MNKKIATIHKTKDLLRKYSIRLNKNLGQHFLIENKVMENIIKIADIKSNDTILEIGAGIGSLTQYILEELDDGKLYAVEKDNRFIKILKDLFSDFNNLNIINEDILQINWDSFIKNNDLSDTKIKVVANLPYYITTPIIESLLFSPLKILEMVFMMQREVAERLCASPGTKDYGSLSVFIQFHYNVKIKFDVSPESFLPAPAVHSSVVKLKPYKEIPFNVENKEFFFKVVRAVFNLRRKNIKNSLLLSPHVNIDKKIILEGLKQCNIDSRIRGEKLSIDEMVNLSNTYWKLLNKEE